MRDGCVLIVLGLNTVRPNVVVDQVFLSVNVDIIHLFATPRVKIGPPTAPTNDKLLNTATNANKPVVYPVVIVDVNGVKCHALVDPGAGSSYASSKLLDTIKAQLKKKEIRRVEMLFGTSTKLVGIYNLRLNDTSNKFHIETEVTRVERSDLLKLDNPK